MKKKLCAEGTVTAVSIYETRNCISKRIQKFSPLRKLLTRICNKPHSIYVPLNRRALIEIILHSAGLCSAKKSSHPQTLPSQRSESALLLFYPSQPRFKFLTLFFPSSVHIPLLPCQFFLLLCLLPPRPLLFSFLSLNPFFLPPVCMTTRLKPDCDSVELLQ